MTAIVVLMLLAAIVSVPAGGFMVFTTVTGEASRVDWTSPTTMLDLAESAGIMLLGVATVVAAVGLLRLKRWAWILAMLIVGVGLAQDVWSYFAQGEATYPSMFLEVLIVFYLNQRDVQRAFGQRQVRDRLLDVPVQRRQ